MSKSDSRLKSFFAVHRDPHDILYIDAADVPDLKWMLDKLVQQPIMTSRFPEMKELTNPWGFAIQVDTGNGKTIYFRKFTQSKIIGKANERGKWTGTLQDGVLTDLQGDVLTFDEQVDCIYFEKTDSVVITSIFSRFETMFDFTEYYVKEAKKAIASIKQKFLLIDDELIPKVLKKKRTIQKITALSKEGFFKDIISGKITSHFFEGTKKKFGDAEVCYSIFDKKVSIEKVEDMVAFVNACSSKYVEAAAGFDKNEEPQLFTTEYKHPFEK